MKILYISYLGLLEPIPKTQVLPYLCELAQKGFFIHLISFEKSYLVKKEKDVLNHLKILLQSKGIAWYRLKYHKYPLVLSSFYDIFIGFLLSLYLMWKHKISVLHARSNIPIAIGIMMKFLVPIQLLYDRRGAMGEEHVEHSGWKKGGWLYRCAIAFEKKAIKRSDAVIVLTDKANKELSQRIKPSSTPFIKTIPCCVDLQKFKYDTHAIQERYHEKFPHLHQKFIFVYSGSVGTYNLVFEMFDFFKLAMEKIPHAHFLILSQNADTAYSLFKKYASLPEERVTIASSSQEELPQLLSLADVGLIFRNKSPSALAASPIKLAEYLACGLAVIALSDIGDIPQIISKYQIGALINSYEKTEYEKALKNILELFQEKTVVKERARKAAKDFFPLHKGIKSYLEVYQYLDSAKKHSFLREP